MGKDKETNLANPNYKWWEDKDLWTEDEGDDLPAGNFTKEEIEEIFKPINLKNN